jgi:hypothetical protein
VFENVAHKEWQGFRNLLVDFFNAKGFLPGCRVVRPLATIDADRQGLEIGEVKAIPLLLWV